MNARTPKPADLNALTERVIVAAHELCRVVLNVEDQFEIVFIAAQSCQDALNALSREAGRARARTWNVSKKADSKATHMKNRLKS